MAIMCAMERPHFFTGLVLCAPAIMANPETATPFMVTNMFHYCAVPENIRTPPMEGFLFCSPPPPSSLQEIPVYFPTFLLKFSFYTPLHLGISNDLPWGGCGFFWNHTLREHV